MQIESGLFPHMVLQPNDQNVSQATCSATGEVLATIKQDSEVLTRVCDTSLEGDSVRLLLPNALSQPHALSYGFGTNSHCNSTDGTDRSLPAFGPLPIL